MADEKSEGAAEQKEQITIKIPKLKMPKNLWMISTFVLLAFTLVLIAYPQLFGGMRTTGQTAAVGGLTEQQAADKAVDYINNNLVQGGEATFVSSEDFTTSMYKVTTKYQGNTIDVYITKDGKWLFISNPYDTTKTATTTQPQASTFDAPDKETPNVKFFVMTFCPYGNQAEDGLGPALELLGDSVEWEPHYVIYSDYASGYPDYCLDEENKYCSMHGIQELNQGVRELCVFKYDKDKWWDFVNKVNEECSSNDADTCWEPIAEEVGIDVQTIKDCEANEAIGMLEAELQLNEEFGVSGSPSVFINDESYSGGRTPEAFKQGICSGFVTEPDSCSDTLEGGDAAAPSGGCG